MSDKIKDLLKDIDGHLGTNSIVKLDGTLLGTRLLKQAREILIDLTSEEESPAQYESAIQMDFMESNPDSPIEPPDPKPYTEKSEEGREIYHYCAHHRFDLTSVVMDGIIQLENKIRCYADYMYVKKLIAQESGADINVISITALAYLGKENG